MERQIKTGAVFVVTLLLVSACSSSREVPPPNARPNTPAGFVQWYQDCWGDFNAKKWDLFKQCYAPNATSQQPGYGKPAVSGVDAIVKSAQDFIKTFPDGHGEGLMILVNGNRITSIYLLKATNTGPLFAPNGQTIPPTNKKLGMFMGHSIELNPE
jgi:SnoaL-like polyketide cyclase